MPHKDPNRRREYDAEWKRRWRAAHPVEQREYAKQWRDRNRPLLKQYYDKAERKRHGIDTRQTQRRRLSKKAWCDKHPDLVRAIGRACRQKKIEEYRLTDKIKAARRRHAPGEFTREQWISRWEFYGKRCAYCLVELPLKKANIDHIIPIKEGGTNWPSNLAPACKSCNSHKSAKRILPTWITTANCGQRVGLGTPMTDRSVGRATRRQPCRNLFIGKSARHRMPRSTACTPCYKRQLRRVPQFARYARSASFRPTLQEARRSTG